MDFKIGDMSGVILALLLISISICQTQAQGILYPQDSEIRSVRSLDGIWNFRVAPRTDPDLGFEQSWFERPLEKTGEVDLMPVPSSYNDITQSRDIREHVGWVWYDREFYVPQEWNDTSKRVFIRFGSVNYNSIVYINGAEVVRHAGGHLPFQVQLQSLNFNAPNRVTVAVNNTLTPETVPQGFVSHRSDDIYPPGFFIMTDNFDFFKYAGIHRSVFLYTTPSDYINDISVSTTATILDGIAEGIVDYSIVLENPTNRNLVISVSLLDKDDVEVATQTGLDSGRLSIPNAKLWWPYTMVENDSDAGYLHTFVVAVNDESNNLLDVYRLKVGIRAVRWTTSSFTINDQPIYFRGFGRHEDSNIRGRGLDNVINVKDHNLLKWIGANSYRTSHYPYSEEIMDIADRLGIVIIDECSAVSLTIFSDGLLETHKQDLTELIQRDKNRASVVMWSVANEPRSEVAAAESYFQQIYLHTRSLDATRPIAIVLYTNAANDKAAQFYDIVCLNRYHNWYTELGMVGQLDGIVERSVIRESLNWITRYQRPFIYTEYGADTVAGLHLNPSFIFTEEFQVEYFREHFNAFDWLRKNTTLFIGEMVWNFADFMTKQEITRIVGNRKGVFTRDRQPKASAHLLRSRYFQLANEYSDYTLPDDLYSKSPVSPSNSMLRNEGQCVADEL